MGEAKGQVINKEFVESMTPGPKTYRVPDARTRGLYIQMTPTGVRSWVLRYRLHGHEKTNSLGRWPELTVALARKKAIEVMGEIGSGNDPIAKRKAERAAKTMKELAEQFTADHLSTLKPGTEAEYARLLKKRILPGLGSKRVKDVDASDVARLLSQIRKDTPKGIEANRTRAVLSKMFSMGGLWGFCPPGWNPARGQARATESKRDRHLSDRELIALGEALRQLEPAPRGKKRKEDSLPEEEVHALAALRLFLLTGMRKSELIGDKKREIPALTWTAVDLGSKRIRLEHHKTSKRVGARIVPLCPAACDLLEELPQLVNNPYVIPGRVRGEALVGLQSYWERVRDAVSKLEEIAKVPKKLRVDVSDVTIHDLRRSFASLAARMGYGEPIVASLLGHSAGTVTAGYARIGADPLRDVVDTIGGRMADLLAGGINLDLEAQGEKNQPPPRRLAVRA